MRENSMYVHLFLVLQKCIGMNTYLNVIWLDLSKYCSQPLLCTIITYFINLFKIVTVFLRNGEIFALVFNIHWNFYVFAICVFY